MSRIPPTTLAPHVSIGTSAPDPVGPTAPKQGLRITELRPGDVRTVLEVFDGLSDHSRFQRFHVGLNALPRRWLRRLTDVHPQGHVVLVAWQAGRPVGLARWIRMPGEPAAAEIAVEVVDRVQGRGIGGVLLDRAARSAAAADVRSFLAFVTEGNRVVRDFAARRGATVDPADRCALRIPVTALLSPAPSAVPSPEPGAARR